MTVQTDRWGGGSVMVWDGISYHHRTALHVCRSRMNAIYYRDNVLRYHIIPFFHHHRYMHTFQQDNGQAHRARVTTQYLANNNDPLLERPAVSPGLTPIEPLWDYLGQRISRRLQMNKVRKLENTPQ